MSEPIKLEIQSLSYCGVSEFIAYNELGLALLGDLKIVRPELKPNWKTEVEDNN